MPMKDRSDLIPAVNGVVRGEIIVQARGQAAKVLIEQAADVNKTGVSKVFKEAENTFWDKCDKIDQKYKA